MHGRPISTVFDLLGHDENDMTASLGWALARNGELLRAFVARIAPGVRLGDDAVVELQEHDRGDGGFIDIELKAPSTVHVIVEAKRGWGLPSEEQLRRYETRFAFVGAPAARFVVLTQNGAEEVVRHRLGGWTLPAPINAVVMSWAELADLARRARLRLYSAPPSPAGSCPYRDAANTYEESPTCAIRTRTPSSSSR
ncbi:MAG: hypothetical protein C0498_10760 [Anaerolinea sp.]|nr:hypothetical protein [Anaerolinea sp.]